MSLVESIFQTVGKACTMLRAQFVHFVLSSGFMILYKIRSIIKVGRSMLPAILKYELAGISSMTAFFVALSRAWKQAEQWSLPCILSECKRLYGKSTCPWVCPRKKYSGAITCANKYQHLHARDVPWKSTLLFRNRVTQITDKGTLFWFWLLKQIKI